MVLTFIGLTVIWRIKYPYFLIWLEGYSYFDTLPDFSSIFLQLPEDIFRYIGAFVLQFYKSPLLASVIQAAIAVFFVSCVWVLLKSILRDSKNMIWLAYLSLPVFVLYQLSDLTLSGSLKLIILVLLLIMIVRLIGLWKAISIPVPGFLRSTFWSTLCLCCAIIASTIVFYLEGSLCNQHETVARLEYYAENQQWDKILNTVSRQESLNDEYVRKYVLLALSETGNLPEYALSYGLSTADDFVFHDVQEPFCLNFNVIFYKQMGLYNYAIYQIYQQAVQSTPGMSFDSMRQLIDIYLEIKDYKLAKKYIDILSHSTCHGKWLEERLIKLEEIKDDKPLYNENTPKFTLMSFLADVSSMVDRYPDDKKLADYLLCGVLAEKDGFTFYNVFQIIAKTIYPDGVEIPRLYQEALLLVASHEPDAIQKYKISDEVWNDFMDFTNMMRAGKVSQAKRKYYNTFWTYVY